MSAHEIANALRAVGADRTKSRELLASLYADPVQLQHVPPSPSDGPIPSRVLAALGKEEVAAVERALPDATVHPSEVSVEGDRVRLCGRIEGTLGDGTRVHVTMVAVFTVADGRIVALRSETSPDNMQIYAAVLAAGAFELPPEAVHA